MANTAVHTWKDEKDRTLNFMLECGRCAKKHTSKISEQEIEDGTVLQQQYGCDCGVLFAIRFLIADWNTVAIVVNEVHPDGTAHQWNVSPQGAIGQKSLSLDSPLTLATQTPLEIKKEPPPPGKYKRSLLLD